MRALHHVGCLRQLRYLVTPEELEIMLGVWLVAFTVDENSTHIPLCQTHYLDVYSKVHLPNPCESCEAKPRKGEQFTRHCPAPDVINGYLNAISNESRNLTSNSTFCLTCYKYFNAILKQVLQATITPSVPTPNIDHVIANIAEKQLHLQNKLPDLQCSEFFELMACLSAHKLATTFRNDHAMLLPTLYIKILLVQVTTLEI